MKYVLIIFTLLLSLGCAPIEDIPKVETVVETIVVTETIIETIEKENPDREIELNKYKNLISNLNELFGYIYYGYASNNEWVIDGFTAFSMFYNGNTYIITAGHAVELNDIRYNYFKFRGIDGRWIEPELLTYNNDYYNGRDYAIFESNEEKGFKVDLDNNEPLFLINESISEYGRAIEEGESGSPVIDIDGEVTEIATTDVFHYNTNIDIILEAIDKLK